MFNYDLNIHTWRHVVNKQILMTYHRLLIEKQFEELNKRSNDVRNEIRQIEDKISEVRSEKEKIKSKLKYY